MPYIQHDLVVFGHSICCLSLSHSEVGAACVAMSTTGSILAELADIQVLLKDANRNEGLKKSLIQSLAAKVNAMNAFDASAARQLSEAVDAGVPEGTMRTALHQAIDSRLAASLATVSKADTKTQLLLNPLGYLTQEDWDTILKPDSSPDAMMAVIARRYSRLGIRFLHEQTVRAAVQIPLWVVLDRTHTWPAYRVICCRWVQGFKREFDILKTPYPHAHLNRYPDQAAVLPT